MWLATCARCKSCHCIVADLHICLHDAAAEVSQTAAQHAVPLVMGGCIVLLLRRKLCLWLA